MKSKLLITLTVCAIGAAAVLGLTKRHSYTDVVNEKSFMEQMVVAELSEEMATNICEELENILPSAPIILRVAPIGDVEYFFKAGRQKVVIQEVYKGMENDVEQQIYLTFSSWSVVLTEEYDSVQCGFVNVMKEGNEYLVFLSDKFEGLDGISVYPLYGETSVAPMFCYNYMQDVVISIEDGPTYVPYSLVKNNEFFATSNKALLSLEFLKTKMIEMYPQVESK